MPLAFTTGTSSHKNTLYKRKFEIKVLLLLHILIPGVMSSSSLETINPWLSACDLRHADFKGSCSAPTHFPTSSTPQPDAELLCPKECSPNETKTNASCLAYLDETRRNAICNFNLGNGIEWLKSFLGTIRLRHCCEYKIIESLSSSLLERVLGGKDECFRIIDSLVEVDNLAAHVTCGFADVLSRYDCGQPYSVKFTCNDCLEAYRRWVCSTLVPYYNDSVRVRPCRAVCNAVEQKCPYFLPENKASFVTQYAGEPVFLCRDPVIPESGVQETRSLYPNDETCCVKVCGSLKEGLCIDNGSKCKSEVLPSYEEALEQTVDCYSVESTVPIVPNLECTGYESSHWLVSGGRRSRSWPTLILFSAFLNQSFARGLHRNLLILLLYSLLSPISHLLVLAYLCTISWYSIPTILLLPCFKTETKLFFPFIKRSSLFLNYLNFGSKRWQYYFILISVNLLINSFIKTPQPLTTPFCFIDGFAKSKKTRRARRYYFFYYNYYYRCKLHFTIYSKSTQNFKKVHTWKRFRELRLGPLNLAGIKISVNKLISLKNNSLTINRIKERSNTYKIINIIRMNRGMSEAKNRSSRGRTKPVVQGPPVGVTGGKSARVRLTGCRILHFFQNKPKSVQKFKLNFVKNCGEASDLKCVFQTFS